MTKKDIYALIKRFYYEHRIQVYVYAFMYADTKTMVEEQLFLTIQRIVEKYNRRSNIVSVPRSWLEFSYIH